MIAAWLGALAVSAALAARSSSFSLRQKLEFSFHGSVVLFVGTLVCYFGPRLWADAIRRQEATGAAATTQRTILALWIFPFIPLILWALATLMVNSGAFD